MDYLYNNSNELINRSQIEDETGLSYSCVDRVLKELLSKGVIIEKKVGRRKIYELSEILKKKQSVVGQFNSSFLVMCLEALDSIRK